MVTLRTSTSLALVALASLAACASGHATVRPVVRVGPIPASVPELRQAAALGTLVGIDPRRHQAEFQVSCGWYYTPMRKIRRGLSRVDLRDLTFGEESNPANMAAGHVDTVSRKAWEHHVVQRGWSGTLRLLRRGGYLSNGPTTDICAGILG